MINEKELKEMITALDSMTPTRHAPVDGKGIYLGDGLHNNVRSASLSNALKEFYALCYKKEH